MPAGSSPKREREYKALKSEFKKEGRYTGREDEVAARIVNKQRAEHGEAKTASAPAAKAGAASRRRPARAPAGRTASKTAATKGGTRRGG